MKDHRWPEQRTSQTLHNAKECEIYCYSGALGNNPYDCGTNVLHHFSSSVSLSILPVDFDGFSGIIPKSSATIAEVLKNYGYNTGAWGKWHNTPEEQITSKGPFEYWPTGYGFEYFYGFLAGEASQYEPTLTRNTTMVTGERPKGYHFSNDIAEDAIHWVR